MRKNLIQTGKKDNKGRTAIPYDWYPGFIPENVILGENVYIDSSFGFAAFKSQNKAAMQMGYASSCYDRSTFVTSGMGKIEIGEYSILNGCTIICSRHIAIGKYVMVAWGAVIYDNYLASDLDSKARADILTTQAMLENREMPFSGSSPIKIEDNVWIGFDAVVKPGTTIGRGSIIGSKSVVSGNIPPYSVVVGNPGRIIKILEPTDKNHKP